MIDIYLSVRFPKLCVNIHKNISDFYFEEKPKNQIYEFLKLTVIYLLLVRPFLCINFLFIQMWIQNVYFILF